MFTKNILLRIVLWGLVFLLVTGLASCQTKVATRPAFVDTPALQQSEQTPQSETQGNSTTPTTALIDSEANPEAIEAAWQSSPHANSYVLDAKAKTTPAPVVMRQWIGFQRWMTCRKAVMPANSSWKIHLH